MLKIRSGIVSIALFVVSGSPAFAGGTPAQITSIDPASGPTSGGTIITIFGANFGVAQGTARFDNVPMTVNTWDDAQIEAVLPEGVGLDFPIEVTTATGDTSNSYPFSYLGPTVESIDPASGPTAGGTVLTIHGSNFGAITDVARIGGVQVQSLSWSHTAIEVRSPEGVGLGQAVEVHTASGDSNSDVLFDYAGPTVSQISPASGPTAGGVLLTIHGEDFGPTQGSVTVGGSTASVQTWEESEITATLPAGVGLDRDVRVITASGISDPGVTFDYNAPTINSISPASGPTSGGILLTIHGADFGREPSAVNVGGMSAPPVSWLDDRIEATLPEGVGLDRTVVVTTASGPSNTDITFDYDPPHVSSITPTSGPTAGGSIITINGTSFGPAPGSVSLGSHQVMTSNWSHTRIVGTLPVGEGTNQPVLVVTASGTSNEDITFDYNGPVVTGITPASGPTSGGVLLTILGENFGATPGTVQIGSADAPISSWQDNRIQATLPEGVGLDLPVMVTVDAGLSTSDFTFDYDPPTLQSISPVNGPTSGGTIITLLGSNFGPAPGSVRIGEQVAVPSLWSHTQVEVTLPPGVGLDNTVAVTTASGTTMDNITFNYNGPTVTNIAPASGPTAGGVLLTILGEDFGAMPGSVSVGGVSAQPSQWSHVRIEAPLPPGVGLNKPVVVTTTSGQSNQNVVFDYDAPALSSVTPTSGPTSGGVLLTIHGTNFGAMPGAVRLASKVAPVQAWGQSEIVAAQPAGCGVDQQLVVTTESGESNALSFDYAPPYPSGDMNCDCRLDTADSAAFVEALISPETFSGCDIDLADVNGDGTRDGRDIQAFVTAVLIP